MENAPWWVWALSAVAVVGVLGAYAWSWCVILRSAKKRQEEGSRVPFIADVKPHNLAPGDRVRWVAPDMYVCDNIVIRKGGVTRVTALQGDNRIYLGGGAIKGLFGSTDPKNVERVIGE